MRIAMVSARCCVRIIKEGTMLQRAGFEVGYFHQSIALPSLVDEISLEGRYNSPAAMTRKLVAFDPDVVHVHAEPAAIVSRVRAGLPDIPIVFDIHDCHIMRRGQESEERDALIAEERKAIGEADAFLYPSDAYAAQIPKVCPDETEGKVGHALYPWLPRWMHKEALRRMATFRIPPVAALVYQGGSLPKENVFGIGYRDMRDIVDRCNTQGIPFYVHAAGTRKNIEHLLDVGGAAFESMEYFDLLAHLSRYTAGLCAPGVWPDPHMEVCHPNKLYEYLAAGLPIVTWGCGEISKHVQARGVGLVLEKPEDLTRELWDDLLGTRRSYEEAIAEANAACVMENQIPKLLSVYKAAQARRAEQ